MTILDEINVIFGSVFNQKELSITPESTANDVEGWDSLSHVTMLVAVEDHFQIEFKNFEIADIKNVGALATLVEKKIKEKSS